MCSLLDTNLIYSIYYIYFRNSYLYTLNKVLMRKYPYLFPCHRMMNKVVVVKIMIRKMFM